MWSERVIGASQSVPRNRPSLYQVLSNIFASPFCVYSIIVSWPEEFRTFFDVFSFLNFNIERASPDCAFDTTYSKKWGFTMLVPLFFILGMG